MTDLIDQYDAALFDLDGVIYLGPEPIAYAADSIERLRRQGIRPAFVTNNAGRSVQTVAAHLRECGIETAKEDIVTSAQAIADLMVEELDEGSSVLVCGAPSLADEIASRGLRVVHQASDNPVAVVQGYDPQMTWPRIDEVCIAIQSGARWYASNPDTTRPTDRGIVPGAGAQIQAVRFTVDTDPVMAGKPYPPLLKTTVARLGCSRPIFIGDRLDTDIEGAHRVGMDSFMVFTGAHGKKDLIAADEQHRPTAIGADLRWLFSPSRKVELSDSWARCGKVLVSCEGDRLLVDGLENSEDHYDALWAACHLVWYRQAPIDHDFLERLDAVR